MLNERCRQVHIGDTHIDPGHHKSYLFQLNDVASLFNFLVHIYTPTHDKKISIAKTELLYYTKCDAKACFCTKDE